MISIYITDKNLIPLPYIESGLVNVLENKPEHSGLIESKICACYTKKGVAVKEFSILINNLDNYVKSFETYTLDCYSIEEVKTSVFWLLKSHFYTFGYKLKKDEPRYERCLSERFFSIKYKNCGCIKYKLKREPVYCLESIVTSSNGIGPTIKSVIHSKRKSDEKKAEHSQE